MARKKKFNRRNKPVANRRGQIRKDLSNSAKERGPPGSPGQPRSPLIPKSSNAGRPKKSGVSLPPSLEKLEENIFERVPMPEGYVFVSKGSVYITRHCRTDTKASKRVVYVVYNRAGKRTLGIRVPEEIHRNVLKLEELTAKKRATAVEARDTKVIDRARGLLLTEFPLMPTKTLEVVLKHAFLKGSGRVGRTSTMSDEQKASYAVEAHIRHAHTPYETMLDSGVGRQLARRQVKATVQAIKQAWAGTTEQKTQHVVVLPDVIEISSD